MSGLEPDARNVLLKTNSLCIHYVPKPHTVLVPFWKFVQELECMEVETESSYKLSVAMPAQKHQSG